MPSATFALRVLLAAAMMLAASAAEARYVDRLHLDFIHVLGPPPATQSAAATADLAAVLAAQAVRTDADVKAAQADDDLSVFHFANAMGGGFNPDNLPFAAAFLKDVGVEANQAIGEAKNHFNRPRPFVEDPHVMPVVRAGNGSYPSGTATFAYAVAILLADMVPEKAPAIFTRAASYAHNRVVAGVHYPTDIAGGRIAASMIDGALLNDAAFMADFAKARAEVRRAVGLP
jgi:acid phosphatase (class A)